MTREDYIAGLSTGTLNELLRRLEGRDLNKGKRSRKGAWITRSRAEAIEQLSELQGCVESEILAFLRPKELAQICKKFKIDATEIQREAITRHLRRSGCVRSYSEYPPQVDSNAKLLRWANRWCQKAEADFELISFDEDYAPCAAAGTLRAVADIYSFNEWNEFLNWQKYGGPKGAGFFELKFGANVPAWQEGTVFLKDPWNFAFSNIFLAAERSDVDFSVRRVGTETFREQEQIDFANAVISGMSYDLSDDEFKVVGTKGQDVLGIELAFLPQVDGEPDEDGIIWAE